MTDHGPSHQVAMPTQSGVTANDAVLSVQALRSKDGWVISVRGPAGPMEICVEEALGAASALVRAVLDVERMRSSGDHARPMY